MDTLGRHVIAELDGCEPSALSDPARIRELLRESACAAGATLISDDIFGFRNGGVSGFALLAESHVSIHTWPEHNYAAIDVYTCGQHTRPEAACHFLAQHLGATRLKMSSIERGRAAVDGGHEHVQVGSLATTPATFPVPRPGAVVRVDPSHDPYTVHSPTRSTSTQGI